MAIQRSGLGGKLRQLGYLLLVNIIFSVFKRCCPPGILFSGVMAVTCSAKYKKKKIQAPKCISHVTLKMLELF